MKADFLLFFLLFMASFRSQKPGPTLVPGVFSDRVMVSFFVTNVAVVNTFFSLFEKKNDLAKNIFNHHSFEASWTNPVLPHPI